MTSVLGGGTAYAYLNSILWGPWNNPDYEWTWDDAPFVTDIQDGEAIHRKKLTLREIADLALNGPNIRANHVTVSDADGISDSADVVIYSHAPLEFPIWNSTTTKYSDWHNISAWIVRSPYASATVTASSSYSVAVTWKIVLGVEPTLQFSEFLKLVFKVGGEYGETATVTKQNDYRFEVPAGPANKQFAIQKRVFWKESLGQAFRYKANGYDGIEHLTETKWCSGSKDEAEKYDAQIFLAERDYDGL